MDGAEVIIEAGVVVEHQLDFRVDPRPLVEPGQLRDLVGPGGDRLVFCEVYCCDISLLLFIIRKIIQFNCPDLLWRRCC